MTTPTTTNANINSTTPTPLAPEATPFLERLASQIGNRAGASTIVAAPIERGGITVVPVARASWGFGGGSGSGGSPDAQGTGEGSGGGGGVSVRPVGYIEIKDGQATFRPIFDPNILLQFAATLGTTLALAMVLRVTSRLVRGR